QTPDNHFLDPILVATLILIRTKAPQLFKHIKLGTATDTDVLSYLQGLPGGSQLINSSIGKFIEAELIFADENEDRKNARIISLTQDAQNEQSPNNARARELVHIFEQL